MPIEFYSDRIVIDVENASTVRYLFITAFHPCDMQSIYFPDRESENVWRYYSIVRAEKKRTNCLREVSLPQSTGPLRSIVPLVGIPAGQEPPAAR